MNALYLIGFVQSLFFIILILSKKKIQLKDYILASYILILGLNLMFMYWLKTGFHDKYPFIIILDFAYWTLLGPLLFLYIDITTSSEPKFKWKHTVHLIPLIFVLIAFSDYLFKGIGSNFFLYKSSSPIYNLGYIVWMYNSPVYYILLIFKIRAHQKKIKDYYASPKDVDLKWLKYLVHGFAVFLFFLLGKGIVINLLKLDITINSYHFTWLVMVIYIFGIGFFGYKQNGIFSESNASEQIMTEKNDEYETENKEQYSKSGLTPEESDFIKENLLVFMSKEKPYLNYDLNLPLLSELINTTPHKLSQVINEKFGLNFFEFINKYRINDVKKLLKDPEKANDKIMALAYDCGFNSKSAFYSFFKKETSLTPTEFRNKYLSLVDV